MRLNSYVGKLFLAMVIVSLLVPGFVTLPTGIPKAEAATVPDWSVTMTAGAGTEGSNSGLAFGVWASATDGFDSGKDVPHPPPAPGATFDGYFNITDFLFPTLDKDYRAPANSIQWTLYVKSSSLPSGHSIILNWDASALPAGSSLQMQDGTNITDMVSQNSVTLSKGEHTITISWTALPNHTVTFNSNGGSGTMTPQVANVPAALTLNTFTRTGYSFSGWNTAANGSGTAYADGATYSFAADITLYAQWTALTQWTNIFQDPNTGTELRINAINHTFEFVAPDGYDSGVVRAMLWQVHEGRIQIIGFTNNPRAIFQFTVNVNTNSCKGNVVVWQQRPRGWPLIKVYKIDVPGR